MPTVLPALLAAMLGATPMPVLVPPVQKIEMREGSFSLPVEINVQMPDRWAGPGGGYLWMLREVLKPRGGFRVGMEPGTATITANESADASLPREGYVLEVGGQGVAIQAREIAGGIQCPGDAGPTDRAESGERAGTRGDSGVHDP